MNRVTLDLYIFGISRFSWDGSSGQGQFTAWEDNLLSFVYGGSNVLFQSEFILLSPGYPSPFALPSSGQSVSVTNPRPYESIFSSESDLANFTGTGNIPLSAEYYCLPNVTVIGGPMTWDLNNSSKMTAVMTYDFTPAPEPGVPGLFVLGGLLVRVCRRGQPDKNRARRWSIDFATQYQRG